MKRLMRIYQKKTGRPLPSHRLFRRISPISRWAFFLIALFAVVFGWYLAERLNFADTDFMFWEFVATIGVFFGLGPLGYIYLKRAHPILLTKDAFARASLLGRYRLVFFKDVKKVKLSRRNRLRIKHAGGKMSIPLNVYEEDLEILKTVFNYEGHFKKPRRPYKLFFEGGEVDLQELNPAMNRTTSKILEQFYEDYQYLTPGYLDDVSLYGATLNRIRTLEARHVTFELSHIDIKRDHPDNPAFHAKQTDDAILIFQDVSHAEIFKLEEKTGVELLGTGFDSLKRAFKRADIFESDFKPLEERMSIDITIVQGVRRQRLRFTFKEAIVGFNEVVKDAWFENTK